LTSEKTSCYNGMEETERRNTMPREKKHENGYAKSPEGVAYRNQYRGEHYSRMEILIPPELRTKIEERAAEEGISRTQLIVKALTAYMEAASESRRKEIKMKTITLLNRIRAMTNEQLAKTIREADEWDPEALAELCKRAGLENEWKESDGDTFESVAYRAAEILGVEI
jgi:hypothetical protein